MTENLKIGDNVTAITTDHNKQQVCERGTIVAEMTPVNGERYYKVKLITGIICYNSEFTLKENTALHS